MQRKWQGNGKGKKRSAPGDDDVIGDNAVDLAASDDNLFDKIKMQRKDFFWKFVAIPGHLPTIQIYVLLETSLPIRRRLLYFIFRHDGHMLDAEMRAKICKRYGLSEADAATDDLASDLAEGVSAYLEWCHGDPVRSCLADFAKMLDDDGGFLEGLGSSMASFRRGPGA